MLTTEYLRSPQYVSWMVSVAHVISGRDLIKGFYTYVYTLLSKLQLFYSGAICEHAIFCIFN